MMVTCILRRKLGLSALQSHVQRSYLSNLCNVDMFDFVTGLMEEVFDRFDVFTGTSDVVPQLPQSNKLQHKPHGARCSHCGL